MAAAALSVGGSAFGVARLTTAIVVCASKEMRSEPAPVSERRTSSIALTRATVPNVALPECGPPDLVLDRALFQRPPPTVLLVAA